MRRARGYTLAELMIVIAIVGITMAVAISGVRAWVASSARATEHGSP